MYPTLAGTGGSVAGTLRVLIERGVVEGVRALLAKSPELASTQFEDGSWPLHLAASRDDAAMVELLVRSGAAMNPKFAGSGHTALSWAVTCWSFTAARKLVELGEQPDLFCAAGMGLLDKVRTFWDQNGVLRAAPS